MVLADAPSTELALPPDGMSLVELLATVKLAASRSEATRLVKSGGVYVNNVRAPDEKALRDDRGCDWRRGDRAAKRPTRAARGASATAMFNVQCSMFNVQMPDAMWDALNIEH